ncbi:Myb-like_DNA-binding domain-containing protein [Hexamita inflata]|uniref:Myb-like DNA-binding domain-containing protein n=1 Tax=Hexamita inflata TaxID=28002 RepID=A0AA86PUC2_9EUKA|nr:Myb-like DNA-binding domain-containing protein [Hexamita inflata]CAI9976887.1 Myb-like DNA-binding domain-containing protein [Hexamita inflata]
MTSSFKHVQYWTKREENMFQDLVCKYNKDFKRYETHFPLRSYNQIRSHYYNMINKQQKQTVEKVRTPNFSAFKEIMSNILNQNSIMYLSFIDQFE